MALRKVLSQTASSGAVTNSLRNTFKNSLIASNAGKFGVLKGGGVGDRPFQRLPPPTAPLDENSELIWDDGVAPETCLDFECEEVSTTEAVLSLLGGFALFGTVYTLVKWSDPASKKTTASRIHSLPFDGLKAELGEA
uniref:Uncharacterized protein n=1 Tax=Fibrocapsa japonica TaxID=94617 RepID=A0A7S2V6V6_9STRA|mmetsp:Transcript_5571/g.8441  ORF Transcript_5571/g.8441 Transcript_5571/m.8441 type:complete len:138 (+) Transcript_5571:119-532(+)|eukprot:CAMPEP_0113934784 /NCGR_PEP_ID=MMETSP1339-20121228/2057_1 /TAXON_ID=94617 /ORGANISM="Fibrocapsa japonica" /LENGTH=137 /DNA_ID=CAMNT_0000936717 /DNA_START=119 /DNA_END=532 /DNA_ORIENTATION=- /assembly_acc=CAM_ASM_000762